MKLLKVLVGILLLVLFFCPNVYAGRIMKTLDENTRIMPPGHIVVTRAEIPMFKKGTVVTLNDLGEILEGTLAENITLPYESGTTQDAVRTTFSPSSPPVIIIPSPAPAAPPVFIPYSVTDKTPQIRGLSFKGGTKVVFNDRGEVIRGTIGSDQTIDLNTVNRIVVSNGEISFHKNGMVSICTLGNDSYLRPVGWSQILTDNFTNRIACSGFVEFKAGKTVQLNERGEVIKGTLNQDTKLLSLLIITDTSVVKGYEAGTTVEFDDKGIVTKATKQ